jgi:UDP-N-acetyl-D-mannosaminuronic acid transferase (WecB/TagA/CpsF family)
MTMHLTEKANQTVARLRSHYQTLVDSGYSERNAIDRVLHDNGNVSADLVFLALGLPYDAGQLVKFGLAKNA